MFEETIPRLITQEIETKLHAEGTFLHFQQDSSPAYYLLPVKREIPL